MAFFFFLKSIFVFAFCLEEIYPRDTCETREGCCETMEAREFNASISGMLA